jgi:hypothetical protein
LRNGWKHILRPESPTNRDRRQIGDQNSDHSAAPFKVMCLHGRNNRFPQVELNKDLRSVEVVEAP